MNGKDYGDRILKAMIAIIERIKKCRDDDDSTIGRTAQYLGINKESSLMRVMQDDALELIMDELSDEVIELIDALWAVQEQREFLSGLIGAPEEFNNELKQSFMKGI